jgi:hypothetical protein
MALSALEHGPRAALWAAGARTKGHHHEQGRGIETVLKNDKSISAGPCRTRLQAGLRFLSVAAG